MKEQKKEGIQEEKIVSPYTSSTKNNNSKLIIAIIVALAVLVLLVIFWSIRQLNVNSTTTNMISYVDSNK